MFPKVRMTTVKIHDGFDLKYRGDQFHILPHEYFLPYVHDPNPAAEDRGYFKDGVLNVLDVGKYRPYKNHFVLVNAVKVMKDRGDLTDDIHFTIGDVPLRKYDSQGQQKSFIVALKLAQYQIIAEQTGKQPILLLDDVFDKLDESRVAELITLVASDSFGQILITDCSHERMERLLSNSGAEYKLFDVTYGKVVE